MEILSDSHLSEAELAIYPTEAEGGNDMISLPTNQFMSAHLSSAEEQRCHRRTKDTLKITIF